LRVFPISALTCSRKGALLSGEGGIPELHRISQWSGLMSSKRGDNFQRQENILSSNFGQRKFGVSEEYGFKNLVTINAN